MASQRVTLARIGGDSATVILDLLHELVSNRQGVAPDDDSDERSSRQSTPLDRARADHFAEELRAHGYDLPVIHFVEWWDPWSMGDVFDRLLRPPADDGPLVIHGDRFVVYGYSLPDGGALARHLANYGPQQAVEYDLLSGRIREALEAWGEMIERSVLVLLREVLGGLVMDEELVESMSRVPHWLSGY